MNDGLQHFVPHDLAFRILIRRTQHAHHSCKKRVGVRLCSQIDNEPVLVSLRDLRLASGRAQSLGDVDARLRRDPERMEDFLRGDIADGHQSEELPEEISFLLRKHRCEQQKDREIFNGAYKDDDLVFAAPDGSQVLPWTFTASFRYLVERAKVPYNRLHDLRDTHASLRKARLVQLVFPLRVALLQTLECAEQVTCRLRHRLETLHAKG